MHKPSAEKKWTYADYCVWPEGERWELIDGVAYAMVPAPLRRHQDVLSNLHYLLRRQLEGRPCRVYPAPFDVRLPTGQEADEGVTTVVQPDISVFCGQDRLDDKGARGAPDLAVEILSPSTAARDTILKRALYERHGVPEYWIVDPETRTVYQFVLESGRFGEPRMLGIPQRVESPSLPGVTFGLDELFPGGD